MKLLLLFLVLGLNNLHSQEIGMPQWGHETVSRNNFGGHHLSLQGQLSNKDGSPASSVTVRITGAGVSQVTVTNAEGEFQFSDLQGGAYDVEADSGTLSIHQTVMLNSDNSQLTLRFDGPGMPEKDLPRNSVSLQQLKVSGKARKEYEKAVEEATKQNMEKALGRLSRALAQYACYSDALTLKSVLNLEAGHVGLAVDEAQRAIHCDGSNGKAYFVLGAALNAQQQYESAIRTLDEGIRFQPDAWQPYYELGKSLLALRRPAEAIRQLKRAEGLSRNGFPSIHALLGSALLQMNDYQSARTQLQLFLQAAPNHPDAEKIRTLLAQLDARLKSASTQTKK